MDAQPPLDLIRPRRTIVGMSAVLLPLHDNSAIDWEAWEKHLQRTCASGLIPAVNMDTGFVSLLNDSQRVEILRRTQRLLAGRPFLAGAYVSDQPGNTFDAAAYQRQAESIFEHQGTPIIFPSFGLSQQPPDRIVDSIEAIARFAPKFYAFELGEMFLPCGRIFETDTFTQIVQIEECLGLKHSSLRRSLEWDRLRIRDRLRPDFQILTGNDLAIDMVMYGSDYLLGLSTFAPDLFSLRDRWWMHGDARFFELNDLLQYLGMLTFRPPVPAYRHSAAQFLRLRGWISSDRTFPGSPQRPTSDREILGELVQRFAAYDPGTH